MAQWISREAMAHRNPKQSWWICPRENFTDRCELEFERMRHSEFGQRPLITSSEFGPSAMEMARARKRLGGSSEAA